MKSTNLKIAIVAAFTLFTLASFAQTVKYHGRKKAPKFIIKDIHDSTIDLSALKGKKVLINFYRIMDCPVCNIYFHEVQEESDSLKQKGVVIISVYEIPAVHMRRYVKDENFNSIMISNPDGSLYNLYKVRNSWWTNFKNRMAAKKKNYEKSKAHYEGLSDEISGDILIDENGKLRLAYYGKNFDDHINVAEIKKECE
ncbi:MAG: redoxin domain-containing protein [Bacteroidetes bacterium]|nr:redoxin domain-containing protein [Bacteroidota bacterium]